MLDDLRQKLMPTQSGLITRELNTGVGPSGQSPVQKLEILDPLGYGQLGEVREAEYEKRHVVVKGIHFKGAHAHLARLRTEHMAGELASQLSALCLAAHWRLQVISRRKMRCMTFQMCVRYLMISRT